jgi:uncharacterized protein
VPVPIGSKRRPGSFDLLVQEMTLRVTGPEELYEEARAAGMAVWEQVQSFGVRHPEFRTSKRPVDVPPDAVGIVRDLAEAAGAAGVGPAFAVRGAVLDHVGRFLARRQREVTVACGGTSFVLSRRRARLAVGLDDEGRTGVAAIVIRPELGPQGVATAVRGGMEVGAVPPGPRGRLADGLVVVATSCALAEAARSAAAAILGRHDSVPAALAYLRRVRGVHGALVVRGTRIGVAGSLELAA